ncbi:MAG: radical SAM protein, partial [Clostridia bacterium]|nr:radical SAM protein [Clostridia bacterium]
MEKPLIIPFFIPHAGCPFTCVYCNQWKISGKEEEIKPEEIDQYVEEYLKKARLWPGRFVEIAFYGGSFTALPPEKQVGLLQAAAAQKKKGRIKGIRLSTRPDYLDEEILARLLSYGVTTVELGVQSLV